MNIEDWVTVTDLCSRFYGLEGKIQDIDPNIGMYLVELAGISTTWFRQEQLASRTYGDIYSSVRGIRWDYAALSEPDYLNITNPGCSHNWKSDQYFTSKVYTTCTKCGAKKEEI